MAHQVRWGILGCARIARLQVIPAIMRCANAQLQAMASREPARLAECLTQFGPFTAHTSYDALLADPAVDAVYLPLPNALHCEWAIKAMRAGKHVLCEKPLALNAAEAERMVAVAGECGVLLMEAFMYRYTDRVSKIRAVLDSGVLGDIRSINSTFRFLLDRVNTIKEQPELGGGALYDVGCYPLNLIGMIAQEEPIDTAVTCDQAHGVDVNLSAVLRYRSGLVASLHCGFNAFGRMHSEITGTQGTLLAPDTFLDDAGELQLITAKGSETIAVAASDRYASEIADFSDAILQKRPPALALEESLRNMRVLETLVKQRNS
ncbi:Gfo/Idh/MocA family protein [Propionivibrio dicarboxylicus]|uniref:Predicted dehydrogenase n=1 Tax=Propionivibrio dicarboxylicus TaxID=83767 RepID=A0A1G8KBA2_9RHOO|nr:Gfo/Idh/MocA family oxidoreductase [Propionivibrio dicarboxylicus]SDI40704.1 Predicted dehydrogenase [Propionivibrio dicarboxylicus]